VIYTRLEIGVGDHPNLVGDDVLYTDIRDCGLTPLTICDVFAPMPFETGQFQHISSHHVLEHCSWRYTDAVLKEWVRLLATEGTMHLELPDLRAQAIQLLMLPTSKEIIQMIFGNQDYACDANVHRSGFSAELLGEALVQAGLTEVRIHQTGGCLVADGTKG